MDFNRLEQATLECLIEAYDAKFPGLRAHLELVRPTKRENTGGGFFTDLSHNTSLPPLVDVPSPLGEHHVDIDGMTYPLGLLIFFDGGYPILLEGYADGDDKTSLIDFSQVGYRNIRLMWNKND